MMKKLLTVLCVCMLVLSLGIIPASAYTLPEGMCVTLDEGRDLSGYKGDRVFGYVGDADVNGKINIRDATLIQKASANIATISDEGLKIADADLSGKINVRDATAIQKWLAGVKTAAPVYHTLFATDDEGQLEFFIGNWVGKFDLAKELNAQLESNNDQNIRFEQVDVKFFFNLNSDGTYRLEADKDSFEDTIAQVRAEYKKNLTAYLEKFIKDNKLNVTVEDVVKSSGYKTMDEMVDSIVPAEEIKSALEEDTRQGRYRIIGNGIYLSDSVDTEPEMGRNALYYDIQDINLVILSGTALISNNMLPAEFVRG